MKLAIMGVVGLLLGLCCGTGAVVMKHRKEAAAMAAMGAKPGAHAAVPAIKGEAPAGEAEKAAETPPAEAEAAQAEPKSEKPNPDVALAPKEEAKAVTAAHAKTSHGTPASKDSAASDGKAIEASHSKVAPIAAIGGAEVRPAATKAPAGADATDRAASFKQLARIFGNMKAADAVKVMAFMSDDEVDGVIRQFQPRQAAELLANFPKERAAALSRRLLSPMKGA